MLSALTFSFAQSSVLPAFILINGCEELVLDPCDPVPSNASFGSSFDETLNQARFKCQKPSEKKFINVYEFKALDGKELSKFIPLADIIKKSALSLDDIKKFIKKYPTELNGDGYTFALTESEGRYFWIQIYKWSNKLFSVQELPYYWTLDGGYHYFLSTQSL